MESSEIFVIINEVRAAARRARVRLEDVPRLEQIDARREITRAGEFLRSADEALIGAQECLEYITAVATAAAAREESQ